MWMVDIGGNESEELVDLETTMHEMKCIRAVDRVGPLGVKNAECKLHSFNWV